MIKTSNLEKFYYSEQPQLKPFEALTQQEKDELELSEDFRKFLIRGLWTKAIGQLMLLLILGAVIYSIYIKNS